MRSLNPWWVAFGILAGVPSAGLWMLYVLLLGPYLLFGVGSVPGASVAVLVLAELLPLVVGAALVLSERARRSGRGVLLGLGTGLLAGFTGGCLLVAAPTLLGA